MLEAPYVNFNKMFRDLPVDPIIANHLPIATKQDREHLNSLLLTKYDGDSLSNAPQCQCGNLHGNSDVGKVCEICGDICETMLNRPVYPMVWLEVPSLIKKYIQPAAWLAMHSIMKVDGCHDLVYLTDRSYVPTNGKASVRIRRLEAMGVQRGINFFYENYAEIMRSYSDVWVTRSRSIAKEEFMAYTEMTIREKDTVFCNYLPMPSRTGFVLESNETGSYLEKYIPQAIDALMTIVSINGTGIEHNEKAQEKRTIKAISKLAPFYQTYVQKIGGGKYGLARKNVISSKMNFSARSVITSITDPHEYDELHVPWTLALSLFRQHLTNLLLRRRFYPRQIFQIFFSSAKSYDPLMAELLDELIRLAGPKGIPVLFQRNPSLKRLSMMYLYIRQFIKNPRINATRLSDLVLRGCNADFDGDQLNKYLPVDNDLRRRYQRFEVHNGFYELKEPWKISDDMNFPNAVARLLTNYVLDGGVRSVEN